MRSLIVLFLFLSAAFCHAQMGAKQNLNRMLEPTSGDLDYQYYRIANKISEDKFNVEVFFLSGNIKMRGTYIDELLTIEDGFFQYFYQNGRCESEGQFIKGRKTGIWKRFENDGSSKKDRYYPPEINQVSKKGHVPASFPGGYSAMLDYIHENITYPEPAELKQIQGTVKISFNIDEEGQLRDITLLESAHYFLDKEAIELIQSMPTWQPAERRAIPVASTYILPIRFLFEGNEPIVMIGMGFE